MADETQAASLRLGFFNKTRRRTTGFSLRLIYIISSGRPTMTGSDRRFKVIVLIEGMYSWFYKHVCVSITLQDTKVASTSNHDEWATL